MFTCGRAWEENGTTIHTAKILMNCERLCRDYRNPGGHECKNSLHLLADSSIDFHLGAYDKDLLWEESLEKTCFGGGGPEQGSTCHCWKNVKPHLDLCPLKNKSLKPLRKGSKFCCPSLAFPGKGEDLFQLGGRKKDESTLYPRGVAGNCIGLRSLEVAYHWGKSRITEKAPPSRLRLDHDNREAPLIPHHQMSKYCVRSNSSLPLWEGHTREETDSEAQAHK